MSQIPGQGGQPPKLVVNMEDLDNSIPVTPAGIRNSSGSAAPYASPALPGIGAQPSAIPVNVGGAGQKSLGSILGSNSIVSGLLAGFIGGVLGFFLSENLYNLNNVYVTTHTALNASSGLWVLIIGTPCGFLLSAWDGFTSGSAAKGFKDGAIGAAIAAPLSFLAGFLAQIVYSHLLANTTSVSFSSHAPARMIAWAIFGLGLGIACGAMGGWKKVTNGAIGGTVGGAIAGLLSEWLFEHVQAGNGLVARMIGLTFISLVIGLGTGLVARARRDSWIQIVSGPMSGKEFILYNALTRIGRDYRCDIVMAKDVNVQPFHFAFLRDAQGNVTVSPEAGAMITINGTPSSGGRINNGDIVAFGKTSMAYQERTAQ